MRRAVIVGLATVALGVPAAGAAAPWGSVSVSAEYRAQWTEAQGKDTRDQDLRTWLGAEFQRTGVEGLSASMLVWYGLDTDGTSESSPFKDTLDSYSNRDDFRVYRAALSYRVPAGWLTAVAGRQEIWSAEIATVDGGLLRIEPCRWATFEVFGGQRVSHYRDPDPEGLYGGNLDLRPLDGTLLRLQDLYYIDNSLELSLVQDLGKWGFGRAEYRMINDDPNEASLGLHLQPWTAAEAHLTYRRKIADAGDDDFTYDYTSAGDDTVPGLGLEPLAPYADYIAEFRQGFLEAFGLGARYRRHNVIDDKDEDEFNADYQEGTLLFDLEGWPWQGLRAGVEYTRWAEDMNRDDIAEDDLWGYVVRAEQHFLGHAVGAGLYRQAYDTDGASRDSAGFELWTRLRLAEFARLLLRYEQEEDDLYEDEGFQDLHRFTARLDLSF